MEIQNIISTILLSILGSSVITAMINVIGRKKLDSATITDLLIKNAEADIREIREENKELKQRICTMEEKLKTMKTDLDEREVLVKIGEKENAALKKKVDQLILELSDKNKQIEEMEVRIKELETKLGEIKRPLSIYDQGRKQGV